MHLQLVVVLSLDYDPLSHEDIHDGGIELILKSIPGKQPCTSQHKQTSMALSCSDARNKHGQHISNIPTSPHGLTDSPGAWLSLESSKIREKKRNGIATLSRTASARTWDHRHQPRPEEKERVACCCLHLPLSLFLSVSSFLGVTTGVNGGHLP